MSLTAGSSVGRYQIQNLLGSGGMGEVYKAVDPTLGRPVALKVLRAELSGDPERMSRFLHEARAASALNHPNILTIHEVGDHDGSRFLVSELVEGETLRAARGPRPADAARDSRHHDPGGVGAVGRARRVDRASRHQARQPDAASRRLREGARLRRRHVRAAPGLVGRRRGDHRADRSRRARASSSAPSPTCRRNRRAGSPSMDDRIATASAWCSTSSSPAARRSPRRRRRICWWRSSNAKPPPVRSIARGLPLQLEWIIEKALEKDPNLRYQSIADLRVDLQRLKSALESGTASTAGAPVTAGRDGGRRRRAQAHRRQSRSRGDQRRVVAHGWRLARDRRNRARRGDVVTTTSRGPARTCRCNCREGARADQGARHRRELRLLGHGIAHRHVSFIDAVDIDDITAMAGLPAARDAIREGTPIAYWRAGITHTAQSVSPAAWSPRPAIIRSASIRRARWSPLRPAMRPTATIAHADRAKATAIGLDAIKKTYGIDASGYELEVVERSFPAGKTEMTWRSQATEVRTHRTAARQPAGREVDPDRAIAATAARLQCADDADADADLQGHRARSVLVGVFVVGWGFGLYYLFKTKNWDALTRPHAAGDLRAGRSCRSRLGNNRQTPASLGTLLAIVAIAILLSAPCCPRSAACCCGSAVSSPARMWAAEQLTRGRLFAPSVPASIVDGVSGGAVMAAADRARRLGGAAGARLRAVDLARAERRRCRASARSSATR